jgi:hypothetical protein
MPSSVQRLHRRDTQHQGDSSSALSKADITIGRTSSIPKVVGGPRKRRPKRVSPKQSKPPFTRSPAPGVRRLAQLATEITALHHPESAQCKTSARRAMFFRLRCTKRVRTTRRSIRRGYLDVSFATTIMKLRILRTRSLAPAPKLSACSATRPAMPATRRERRCLTS